MPFKARAPKNCASPCCRRESISVSSTTRGRDSSAASAYLDDRPAAPLRFLAEANLTLMVRRQEDQVDREESRNELRDRIRAIFTGPTFELIPFAAGPEDVGDDIGDGRPRLCLIGYDAEAVRGDRLQIPAAC